MSTCDSKYVEKYAHVIRDQVANTGREDFCYDIALIIAKYSAPDDTADDILLLARDTLAQEYFEECHSGLEQENSPLVTYYRFSPVSIAKAKRLLWDMIPTEQEKNTLWSIGVRGRFKSRNRMGPGATLANYCGIYGKFPT